MMHKRWEIYLKRDDYREFHDMLEECGHGIAVTQFQTDGYVWLICYPPDDIKMIARLRFDIKELVDKFGIDIDFSDCPKIQL